MKTLICILSITVLTFCKPKTHTCKCFTVINNGTHQSKTVQRDTVIKKMDYGNAELECQRKNRQVSDTVKIECEIII